MEGKKEESASVAEAPWMGEPKCEWVDHETDAGISFKRLNLLKGCKAGKQEHLILVYRADCSCHVENRLKKAPLGEALWKLEMMWQRRGNNHQWPQIEGSRCKGSTQNTCWWTRHGLLHWRKERNQKCVSYEPSASQTLISPSLPTLWKLRWTFKYFSYARCHDVKLCL